MNKAFNFLFKTGKGFLKDAAGDLVEQGKETVKAAANEKVTGAINTAIQNASFRRVSPEAEDADAREVSATENMDFSEEAYQDADAFEEGVRGNLKGMFSTLAAADPVAAKEVLDNFVHIAGDVAKFSEVQKTKRKEIEAKRDVIVNKIQSQKEIILAYLEKSFDERKDNFAKLFSVVDSAIATNNMQQLAMGLDSINKLAESSPFKALASVESTKLALEDKNHEWDF
jgi:hypothetical protein